MNIFYTSDQHFNHQNIIEYSNRPFASVQEMNEAIIDRYNAVVSDEDVVYFLGDVFFRDFIWAAATMKRLHGMKILIMGNHDRKSKSKYRDIGFREVCKQLDISIDGNKCWMYHKPSSWSLESGIRFQLHGHTHSTTRIKGRHVHVGVDAWNFTPASHDEIVALMRSSVSA